MGDLILGVREMKRNGQVRLSSKSVAEGEKWESVVYQSPSKERSGEGAESGSWSNPADRPR